MFDCPNFEAVTPTELTKNIKCKSSFYAKTIPYLAYMNAKLDIIKDGVIITYTNIDELTVK